MAQLQNPSTPTVASDGSPTNSMGLKAFNRTGQEDTTTEVLRQTVTPETQRRNVGLIVAVIVVVGIMLAIAYQRSGLSFIPSSDTTSGFGSGHAQGDPDHAQ